MGRDYNNASFRIKVVSSIIQIFRIMGHVNYNDVFKIMGSDYNNARFYNKGRVFNNSNF